METAVCHGPRFTSTFRSSNGCWTCRLRRKKCDESRPVCDTCAALLITCHYGQDRPEWMDGGARQEEMAERLKREVKEKAHRRPRGERAVQSSSDHVPVTAANPGEVSVVPQGSPACNLTTAVPDLRTDRIDPCPEASTTARLQRGPGCTPGSKGAATRSSMPIRQSDTILLTFYLEHVLPFLFPFYHPSPLQGGKAWILAMIMGSPVVRQAALCQSSYFFSLAAAAANWEAVLVQTRDTFEMLRQALQVITGSGMKEHLHGAVRIMASIIQVQRFEIAISSFENCQAHLNASVALFKQLLGSAGAVESASPRSSFDAVMDRLGPSTCTLPDPSLQIPGAEQAAFRFSSALLVVDDIIASTALQEQPKLYEYHRSLLSTTDGTDPPIDLVAVLGCQNWAFLHISEVAVLDAWKQQRKRAGSLNVMELVHRATTIKDSLETHLLRLDTVPATTLKRDSSLLDFLTADGSQQPDTSTHHILLVTRVWAHAALLYLSIVISGWQPASVDVRYHVGRVVELLTRQLSPPELLRTMVWPFFVAGCLAEPEQETHLRATVEAMQPPTVFGTLRRALEIMEDVWRTRHTEDTPSRDLARCLRSQGDLILLV